MQKTIDCVSRRSPTLGFGKTQAVKEEHSYWLVSTYSIGQLKKIRRKLHLADLGDWICVLGANGTCPLADFNIPDEASPKNRRSPSSELQNPSLLNIGTKNELSLANPSLLDWACEKIR